VEKEADQQKTTDQLQVTDKLPVLQICIHFSPKVLDWNVKSLQTGMKGGHNNSKQPFK